MKTSFNLTAIELNSFYYVKCIFFARSVHKTKGVIDIPSIERYWQGFFDVLKKDFLKVYTIEISYVWTGWGSIGIGFF